MKPYKKDIFPDITFEEIELYNDISSILKKYDNKATIEYKHKNENNYDPNDMYFQISLSKKHYANDLKKEIKSSVSNIDKISSNDSNILVYFKNK